MSLLTSISTVAFHGNNRGAKAVAWLFHLYRTFIFDIIIEIRCNTFKIGHDTSKAVKCEGMNICVCVNVSKIVSQLGFHFNSHVCGVVSALV